MSGQVSVVIPTYNGVRFIRDALASVFAQTQLPAEVIVVDDGSKDETVAIAEELAASSPVPLRVMRMPANSGGPAAPLNTGLAAATSELVAILEQDDLMAPRRLERLCEAASRHPECLLVIGRPAIVKERDGALDWAPVPPPDDIPQYHEHSPGASFVVPSDVAFRSLMKSNFIYSNSNVLLRRRDVLALGGFDPSWPINSDADLEFRILMESPIAVVNEVLCGYRDRPDSLYHSRGQRARLDGLLIRLKRGGERWHWAAGDVQRVYWALRADLKTAIRSGHYAVAWRIVRALATSVAMRRHLQRAF